MKRSAAIIASFLFVLLWTPSANAASPHFMSAEPGCWVSGLTVTCDGSDIAGVGNTNAEARLMVNVSLHVECLNPGTNDKYVPPHDTVNTTNASTGKLEPKNGRLLVPVLSASGSDELPNKLCPNRNWTYTVEQTVTWSYQIVFLTKPSETVFYSISG